jgi:OOP family OmpA-OmpF porin
MKNQLYLFLLLSSTQLVFAQVDDAPMIIEELESIYDDIAPVVSPSNDLLYFTKKNHPDNAGGERDPGDIWMSKKMNKVWMAAERVKGPINNHFFNSIIGITPDGTIMYLTGNYESPKKGGVSFSRKIADNWSEPKSVDIPYYKNKSDHISGSLSSDGKIMVLSIESFSTIGNEDLYYSFRRSNDRWTELRSLGADINTNAQELTPFLANDNKTLFFSSNGLGGAGSRDVFFAKRLDATWNTWSKPENIQEINTEGADWYYKLTSDPNFAVMVNTINSVGLGNILSTKLPENVTIEKTIEESMTASATPLTPYNRSIKKTVIRPKIPIHVKVLDGLTGNELNPQLIIKGINELNKSSYSEIVLGNGSSYTTKLYKDSVYTVDITMDGYLDEVRRFKIDTLESNDEVIFSLVRLEKGTTIQLQSVLFQRGTATMQESSFEELDRVVGMLKKNPNIEIELSGHTDNTGSSKLNIELSQKRSNTVKEYMVSKGISDKRLESRGYGGSKPISSNKSEATRKLNRRVEFTIIKN